MEIEKIFNFGKHVDSLNDGKIVKLPGDIASKRQLLQAYYDAMELPGYFGFNWDALSDCLRDLSWIDSHRVIIIHEELPAIEKTSLKNYLHILQESILDWRSGEDHQLIVVFPLEAKQTVVDCMVG